MISDDYQKMIISCYLCQDKIIEILKHEYFTHKFKERVAVYYFEQKEYEELSHQKTIDISENTILPSPPSPND